MSSITEKRLSFLKSCCCCCCCFYPQEVLQAGRSSNLPNQSLPLMAQHHILPHDIAQAVVAASIIGHPWPTSDAEPIWLLHFLHYLRHPSPSMQVPQRLRQKCGT